ncbi:MAG: OadG family protein [Paludibacteraceae bacterium]|nr:OadG family protein [Paludibacteraceae bacterium]
MTTIMINWTNALIITLLGFALVFCLLILLVFVLKLFGLVMHRKEESEPKAVALTGMPASKISGAPTGPELAAIAMAIRMFYDEECSEVGELTFESHPTAWNSKLFGLNNLVK